MDTMYDVIVVGAGHAGSEAAAAAANMGSRVLLITMDMTKIGQMSCNPAMGGIAKGQIVREIDALGGYSGIVTDASMIQYRLLNRSKGPAMWSPRAQNDRMVFASKWRELLENIYNIDFWQDAVTALELKNGVVHGVRTKMGIVFDSKTVVLTTGTFENGLIHIGNVKLKGGRISESRSEGLSAQLKEAGFEVGRMKTGTPARLDGRSIDFENMQEQKGDEGGGAFSFMAEHNVDNKRSCFITHTSEEVHAILREGFQESPMFNGTINSIGPRYCPSIEDKVVTFADKDKHQLFIEPEGLNTYEYYVNGFSSSLPWEIQYKALQKVKGLENVRIFRPGYAIEYDYYSPTQLHYSLETKFIKNLFFAGQINGTTGYEEAAAQGIMAGINAHLTVHTEGTTFTLGRNESYIGVLIDDLINKGVDEPYRMFTSRAEYRTLLSQDNADERLTLKSYGLGLAGSDRKDKLDKKMALRTEFKNIVINQSIAPDEINGLLEMKGTSPIKQKVKLKDILARPQINIFDFLPMVEPLQRAFQETKLHRDALQSAEIEIKYSGYKEREKLTADKMQRLEGIKIRDSIDYNAIHSLSTEAKQKLSKIQPETIGQASRISGVNPSDINILLIYHGR
ncbi:MAG: tRNA uridine-5-carboxymethylaminomethyl(34) synthesis enzyme MnmG [Bacteroidetes bacterium]|jgi:tRNA uridine 5-carboxymethylaminomethyl modification enzyme|nr:tRNA uridine-5-carboxymethylaminomethyl(34) synthesis enzyme MnmG [Bacteroidota bacterium]